jgi:DNA-binding SARP family transcriptional activator
MDLRCRIELLGGLRAARDGSTIARFQTRQTGLLLAYMAYHLRRSHPRTVLCELLWPEDDLEIARHKLRVALSALRRQLEPPGSASGSVLVADRSSVQLNAVVVTTDVADYELAIEAAVRAARTSERTEHLVRAVELYGGELLPGYTEDWVFQERGWLAERYFQALHPLLSHLEQKGDLHRALEYAHRGVNADPLREESHAALMRLYAAAGQTAAALRQYRHLERLLKQELGTTPEPATRVLAREIERSAVLRPASSVARSQSSRHIAASDGLQPAGSEGEHRLATLLLADVSRSLATSRDASRLPGATRIDRLLPTMVDILLRYEGRMRRLTGSGLLAVFGTPMAHEDDTERAIQAAMEIREAAHSLGLQVTAGIATGRISIGEIGIEEDPGPEGRQPDARATSGSRIPGSNYSNGSRDPIIRMAARLQQQAEPGQIVVGEPTYRLTRRAFAFAPCARRSQAAVVAYVVTGALSRPEKARGIDGLRTELIGRDEELAKLTEALAATRQGRGEMVSLIGEAGVGKSRLVAELKQTASGADEDDGLPRLLWLEGRCLELGMAAGYSAFLDLFRDYFGWHSAETDRSRGERIVASLQEFVGRGELTAARAAEMAPLLGNLLSARFGDNRDERLENAPPEQIRYQTLLAVRDFFATLARQQPVALILEDLHWADALSLDLISLLMEALRESPMLLVCVHRPEREHKSWHLATIASRKCPEAYTELALRELTPPQSRRLLERILTMEDGAHSLREWVLEHSHGNPFFLEELVGMLIDTGRIYREGDVWRARKDREPLALPESIHSVILSRVDRLGPMARQVLENASAIGRLFRRRLLEQMMGKAAGVEAALWELEERGLIYPERTVPEEEYSFKHVLTRETIYQNTPRRYRAVLHQQVGEALEALYHERLDEYYEPLAYHYERSQVDEKAVEYLLKAGEKARRAYLNDEAIGCFQRALARLEGALPGGTRPQRRLEALKGLGQIYHGTGKEAEAEEKFRQAIAVGREIGLAPRELVRLYGWLGDVLWWRNQYDEIIRLGEEGLALMGDETHSVEAALMTSTAAVGYLNRGSTQKWRELTYRNAQFLQQLPYTEELLWPYVHIILVYAFGARNVEEAMKWLQALERRAEQHHDLRALGQVYRYTGADILASQGDLSGAITHCQQAVELFGRIGDDKHRCLCLQGLGRAFLALGDLRQAEAQTRQALELAERVGNIDSIAALYQQLGTILLSEGSWERATEAWGKAFALGREIGEIGMEAARSLGRAYLMQGERQAAARQFQEAAALAAMNPVGLAAALSGLEDAWEDPEEFRGFCRRFRAEHPEVAALPFQQWYLKPALPLRTLPVQVQEEFVRSLSADWTWHDPFRDGSFAVQHGLEIRAANGRDLWELNVSAPRMLRPMSSNVAVQTVCLPALGEKPAMGGLLLWKDRQIYLRLDRGARGKYEITFSGCLENQEILIGRGRLRSERVYLRLEWIDRFASALCSADGQEWFTVGRVALPVEDPVEVGLYAIGQIDRTVFPGAHPEGTTIRFETFEVWAAAPVSTPKRRRSAR